jgi:integrase
VTFHQLRHTNASHLAQRVPLPIVGAVLGHASPSTTARYAHVNSSAVASRPELQLAFGVQQPAAVAELHAADVQQGT